MKVNAQTIAWIFYAVEMVASNTPASRTDISAAADAINHAVPTQTELNESLHWLATNGLVTANGKFYSMTDAGLAIVQSSRLNAPTVMLVWSNLTKALTAFSSDP